jgi:TatD DNase family protein
MLIDSHCHLDVFAADASLPDVVRRAAEAGVGQMLTMGTSAADWPLYAKMAAEYPGVIHWGAGLHPTEVGEDWEEQLASLASWFATSPHPVAIGEVGLDYHHLPADPAEAEAVIRMRKAAFAAQLEIAYQMGCPFVVHARKAFADCVAMIDKSGVDWRKVVFHCFSEGVDEVRILNARGGRASFTGTVTYKNAAGVLAAAVAQGPELLMVETDAPYLAPEPFRGRRCEPAHVALTARKIAGAMGLGEEQLFAIISANTKAFFGV